MNKQHINLRPSCFHAIQLSCFQLLFDCSLVLIACDPGTLDSGNQSMITPQKNTQKNSKHLKEHSFIT